VKTRSFVDAVTVHAIAGNGGNGCTSFRREKYVPFGGPDGGDGGNGGDVILRGSNNEDSLLRLYFDPHLRSERGGHGRGQEQHGKDGAPCVVNIPTGTEIRSVETGLLLGDIVKDGQELVVAKGGKGGGGNIHWKSSINQAPTRHTDGEEGERFVLRLTLKLIADAGLVGYPNAGKSSILSRISDAHPKIAAYPFTTLNPVIGTMMGEGYSRIRVADIPGLIHGAHNGVGLGFDFLRHIERAPVIVLVIDMAGTDGRDPVEDYLSVREEMRLYREDLLQRPSLLVANKMDRQEAAAHLKNFRSKTKTRPISISAETGEGMDAFRKKLTEICIRHRPQGETAK
jgi:GTP-binding protein